MKTTFKWLGRNIAAPGPYLCLCLSEAEYKRAFKHCKEAPVGPWITTPQANATAHFLTAPSGLCAVVCINPLKNSTGIEIAGLLVHESVHVWQEWCSYYGETTPASEQEAYAVQAISQELMKEYARRVAV